MPPELDDDFDFDEYKWHGEKVDGYSIPFKHLPSPERTKAQDAWNENNDYGETCLTGIQGNNVYKVILYTMGSVARLERVSNTVCKESMPVPKGWLTTYNAEIVSCRTLDEAQLLEQSFRRDEELSEEFTDRRVVNCTST